MRAIEFRGRKRTTAQPKTIDLFNETEKEKEPEWIYGSFSNGIDGKGAYIMPYCYTSGWVEISEDVDEDGEDVIEYSTDVFLGGWIQVFPESVGQYTGLLDKNGTKIFEGDIIQYMNDIENGKGAVELHSSCFYVVWFEQNTSKPSIWTTMNYLQCSAEIEVIGNVFDNEDLL